ncbi:MAG TPA: gamma-glutamyltransferase [Actinomycetota bacterium]
MVATSHPLGVDAGLGAIEAGGNAVDAAVAAAAVLAVVDPPSTGIGGDLFALVWPVGSPSPQALAAAGCAPAGLSVDALRDAGYGSMPGDGAWTVTVPGGVAGWAELLERQGRLGLDAALRPAIAAAEGGFQVTPVVARSWAEEASRLARNEASRAAFLLAGRAPAPAERFANPDLARTLRAIAEEGPAVLYGGPLGERIAAAVERAGGPMRASDLAAWGGPSWSEPIAIDHGGARVYEHPPPGQGIVVLEALGIYEKLDTSGRPQDEHAAIEALRLAFADAFQHLADPAKVALPIDQLLAKSRLQRLARDVRPHEAARLLVGDAPGLDTVYVAAVDPEGGGCSLIQSLFHRFGSKLTVPETGVVLQNRGAGFTLTEGHPNRPEPGKRPYHTIIPGMLGATGRFLACLGVVGGFMQPQGQLQIIRNVLDRDMDPQAAIDAPRFRVAERAETSRVGLEKDFPSEVADELAARGHAVVALPWWEAGGAQMILRDEDGSLVGGSDPRKDGLARALE